MIRDILLAPSISTEPILQLPNAEVYARKLSGLEVMNAEAEIPDDGRKTEDVFRFGVRLVVLGACDKEGNRIFKDEDFDAVYKMPYDSILKLVVGVKTHNGMGDEAKNSPAPSTATS